MEQEPRHIHVLGATGQIRTASHDGREHIVVPVVALIEGVIHAINADTPEYVPISSLQAAPQGWNGRPVVFGHPIKNGVQISANDPGVLAERGFGQVFQSRIAGKKLLMEAWIDPARAEKVGGQRMLQRLKDGEIVEVSVGAFVVTEGKAGNHNGKPYKAIWRDIVPDHLAFLQDGVGACSVSMGCGTHRAAQVHIVTPAGTLEVLGGPNSGRYKKGSGGNSKYTDDAAGHAARVDDWVKNADKSPSATPQELEGLINEASGEYGLTATTEHPGFARVVDKIGRVMHIGKEGGAWRVDVFKNSQAEQDGEQPGESDTLNGDKPAMLINHAMAVANRVPTEHEYITKIPTHRAPTPAEVKRIYESSFDPITHRYVDTKRDADKKAQAQAEAIREDQLTNDDYETAKERMSGPELQKKWQNKGIPKAVWSNTTDPIAFAENMEQQHNQFKKERKRKLRNNAAQIGELHGSVDEIVEKLSVPTEPAIETANLNVLRALCMSMYGTVNSIMSSLEDSEDPEITSSPRYLEAMTPGFSHTPEDSEETPCPICRTLIGARNSQKDLSAIQEVHDHSVKLGADCWSGMRTLQGEMKMSKDERAAVIRALVGCTCSGFTSADVKMLETMTDERLEAFNTATEARKEVEAKLTAAEAKITESEAKLKAAEAKTLSEAEFMAAAPATIKTLIVKAQKQEAEQKAFLVAELKAAQSEFTEEELGKMGVDELTRLGRVVKIEQPDFSGRGIPRAAAEKKDDTFTNPPDPYAEALKVRRAAAAAGKVN